ncbi:Txe/YoeB family addiction module toxin [Pedobacter hiemivivus]|uniref:Txe/YoeB family addiction module toxin n=1 Tax=Pedobacter hiemivivus TaxID=2530454 RepID=UPI0021CECE50|nr:Txe/YoeB family addiction module toxin [Pedobacter hiemivivus]
MSAIEIAPYSGTGKPEALKYSWSGWWSRRINKEHRLIYKVEQNTITVFALRFHYD